MELKVLLYIIGGIGYFLYSIYKNKQEESSKKANKKQSQPSPLDTIEEELKKLEEQLKQTNKPKPKPTLQTTSKKTTPKTYKSKEILIHDDSSSKPIFEEGNTNADEHYSRKLTYEELLHEERIKNSQKREVIMDDIQDENGIDIDARKAFISSLIFDRPYR